MLRAPRESKRSLNGLRNGLGSAFGLDERLFLAHDVEGRRILADIPGGGLSAFASELRLDAGRFGGLFGRLLFFERIGKLHGVWPLRWCWVFRSFAASASDAFPCEDFERGGHGDEGAEYDDSNSLFRARFCAACNFYGALARGGERLRNVGVLVDAAGARRPP